MANRWALGGWTWQRPGHSAWGGKHGELSRETFSCLSLPQRVAIQGIIGQSYQKTNIHSPPRLSCDMSTPLTWTFILYTALWGGHQGSDLVLRMKNWEMRELSLLWHLSLFTSQGFELDRAEFESWLGHEELERAIHYPSPRPPHGEMGHICL